MDKFTALLAWIIQPEDIGDVAYVVCQNLKNMWVKGWIRLWAWLFMAFSGNKDELFDATNVNSTVKRAIIWKEIDDFISGLSISDIFVEINDNHFIVRRTEKKDLLDLMGEISEEDEEEDEEMEEDEDDNATITVEHMEQWRKENQKNLKTKKEFWDAYNTELFNFVNTL